MKAYIQVDKTGNYYYVNAYLANEGFIELGWETIKYQLLEEIEDSDPESIIVGGISNVRNRLIQLGITKSKQEIDYPPALKKYLGRKMWEDVLENVFAQPDTWGIFMKPKDETKKFTGKIFREFKDFLGLINPEKPTKVICSEVFDFRTEWRCFVRYGEILDIRRYKGAWDSKLDLEVVKNAIKEFDGAPAAYGIDFGVDKAGNTRLVEVNDGHSLGTYGIGAITYAKFLSARWAELTGTKDYTYF